MTTHSYRTNYPLYQSGESDRCHYKKFMTFLCTSLIVLLFSANTLIAQQKDSVYTNILYKEIRLIQDSGVIYYSDRLERDVYESFLSQLPDELKILKAQGVNLNQQERDFLLSGLKDFRQSTSPLNLFPTARQISSDTIIAYVESIFNNYADSLRKVSKKAIIKYKTLPWAFFFSDPIYLRDQSLCFFYFMYFRKSSGGHGLMVYKKHNNKWIKVSTIGGGAW